MMRKFGLLVAAVLMMGMAFGQPAQSTLAGCRPVTVTVTNLSITITQAKVTYNLVGGGTYNINFTAKDQSSGYTATVGSGVDTGVSATTGRVFSFALNSAQVAVGEDIQVMLDSGCGTTSASAIATSGVNAKAPAACDDGRINYNHCDKIAMFAIKDEGSFGLNVLIVDHLAVPRGAIFVSAADLAALPDNPARNTLIAISPDGLVTFHKLKGGEYQVNYGPDADNKVFVFRWRGLPPEAYPNVITYINNAS